MICKCKPAVWFILFMILSPPLFGGWFIVEKREDRFGNVSMQSIFIQGQKVRIESLTSTFIFDVETKNITVIFPKQSVYWNGNHNVLKMELLQTIERQIELMIQQLHEYERKEAEADFNRMMLATKNTNPDSLLPATFRIVKTDSSMLIGAYLSHKYQFVIDTLTIEELWATQKVKPYSSLNLGELTEMMRIFNKPSVLSASRESSEWLHILQNGLVMRSVIPGDAGRSVMQVENVREAEIPHAFFDAPPNYRSIGITEVIGIMMGDTDAAKTDANNLPLNPFQRDKNNLRFLKPSDAPIKEF